MRSGSVPRGAVLGWLLLLALALGTGVAEPAAEGDVSDAAAKATLEQIKRRWGLELPFLAQVLYRVPVLKATREFLGKNGSSIGIYDHGRVYVSGSLFRSDGALDVDSSVSLAVLVHECWHAYYELLLPKPQKAALNREFRAYYNRGGAYPEEQWICFGDEAIANYYGDLTVSYAYAVRRFLQLGTAPEGVLNVYRASFDAKELHGYGTDDAAAPLPISAEQRRAALRMAAGAFPPPDRLIQTLRQRFPSACPPAPPAPGSAEDTRGVPAGAGQALPSSP